MDNLEKRLWAHVTMPNTAIVMGLDRIERLLTNLGNPQRRMPPTIHVAGTNGKGSTIAFMRACLEAAGMRVHAYTSPHLIHVNERIRLAGELAGDEVLLSVFDEIAAANAGEPITYFEMLTVAAFVLFARVPADVLLLEVGMGGRLDATNVITPAVSVITRISMDHTEFLGDTIEKIAGEKAAIIKPGVPCVVGYQADEAAKKVFRARAAELDAPLYEYGHNFSAAELPDGFLYQSKENTKFPSPALLGAHQILNAAAAITAVKLFSNQIMNEHIRVGLRNASWPGRLQHITAGPVAALLPDGFELWYDGAHNDSGADALAEQCRRWRAAGSEIHLILGMLSTKNPAVFAPVTAQAKTVSTVSIPGGAGNGHTAADLAAKISGFAAAAPYTAASIEQAIHHMIPAIRPPGPQLVLVAGSLHLAQLLS